MTRGEVNNKKNIGEHKVYTLSVDRNASNFYLGQNGSCIGSLQAGRGAVAALMQADQVFHLIIRRCYGIRYIRVLMLSPCAIHYASDE